MSDFKDQKKELQNICSQIQMKNERAKKRKKEDEELAKKRKEEDDEIDKMTAEIHEMMAEENRLHAEMVAEIEAVQVPLGASAAWKEVGGESKPPRDRTAFTATATRVVKALLKIISEKISSNQ